VLDVLEQTGACRVLVALNSSGAIPVSEAIRKVGVSQQAVYNALRKLKDAGLIEERMENEFPRRRLISLTEKGKVVAGKLEEIEQKIKV